MRRDVEEPDAAEFEEGFVRVEGEDTRRVRLRWDGGAWRIVRMSRAVRRKSAIPYGTPVSDVDPRTGELLPGARGREGGARDAIESTGRTRAP